MIVNEGYEIIAHETYSTTSDRENRVVLGRKETSFGMMFVTWESTAKPLPSGNERVDYYWGHYFNDEREARADYHKRLLTKYEG